MVEQTPFTLIMRTKNSGCFLEEALAGVFKQTVQPKQFIAIDSGSTDNTLDILKRHPEIEIVQIQSDEYIPGPVLNKGMELANEDIVLLLNSDAAPINQDCFEKLIKPLNHQQIAASYGRQVPRKNAKTWVKRDYLSAFPKEKAPEWMNLSFCLAALKRALWKSRPFYSLAWGSEDAEWGSAMKRKGFRIKYVPSAKAIHSHNYSLKGIYGRKFIEGEADAFISNRKISIFTILIRYFRSVAADIGFHIHEKDFLGVPMILIRRFVYHWSYFQGWRYGLNRKKKKNFNPEYGKNIVLSRYE